MSWNNVTLREREKESITHFMLSHSDLFRGEVLDFGCGKQPYRQIIESVGGKYTGFDRKGFPASTVKRDVGPKRHPLLTSGRKWDAIVCNQVVQYLGDPWTMLRDFFFALQPGGWLVMTGPTNWPEVEKEDLTRFTVAGMAFMLELQGYVEITVSSREAMMLNDIGLSLGWGAIARRPS